MSTMERANEMERMSLMWFLDEVDWDETRGILLNIFDGYKGGIERVEPLVESYEKSPCDNEAKREFADKALKVKRSLQKKNGHQRNPPMQKRVETKVDLNMAQRIELHSLARGIPCGLDVVIDDELEDMGLVICTRREVLVPPHTQSSRYSITILGERAIRDTNDQCKVSHCPCHAMATK